MGIETEVFENSEGHRKARSSSARFVGAWVDPPVTTPCEHLFCEGCLLSWLQRRETGTETCPMCNTLIDPQLVDKPSRIIVNLLGEMRRHCDHRGEGCQWVGPADEHAAHTRGCEFVPRRQLRETIDRRDCAVAELQKELRGREEEVVRPQARAGGARGTREPGAAGAAAGLRGHAVVAVVVGGKVLGWAC